MKPNPVFWPTLLASLAINLCFAVVILSGFMRSGTMFALGIVAVFVVSFVSYILLRPQYRAYRGNKGTSEEWARTEAAFDRYFGIRGLVLVSAVAYLTQFCFFLLTHLCRGEESRSKQVGIFSMAVSVLLVIVVVPLGMWFGHKVGRMVLRLIRRLDPDDDQRKVGTR